MRDLFSETAQAERTRIWTLLIHEHVDNARDKDDNGQINVETNRASDSRPCHPRCEREANGKSCWKARRTGPEETEVNCMMALTSLLPLLHLTQNVEIREKYTQCTLIYCINHKAIPPRCFFLIMPHHNTTYLGI
jgi:hypothetical protein